MRFPLLALGLCCALVMLDVACALQAWGLMELQRGNWLASLILLERCVDLSPALSPVLRWKAVQDAKQAVCQQRMPSLAAPKGVTCA